MTLSLSSSKISKEAWLQELTEALVPAKAKRFYVLHIVIDGESYLKVGSSGQHVRDLEFRKNIPV